MAKVEVNGTRLHYEERGDPNGEVVLFAHGLLFHSGMFVEQVAALARRGYRVLAFDWRGQGRSEGSGDAAAYGLDSLAVDAWELLQALGVGSCHWAGLSMGGIVGFRMYFAHPEVFRSLILLDTSADAELPERVAQYEQMSLMYQQMGPVEPLLQALPHVFFSPATIAGKPEVVAEWVEYWKTLRRDVLPWVEAGVDKRSSVVDRVGAISVPTLIVVGADDAATPLPRSEQLHELIAGSQIVVIPSAGHSSTVEQPEAVTNAIVAFLESVRR
ncbi:MAG: alpha/beta fold hydrolase [Ktedonobacterales bacterium]